MWPRMGSGLRLVCVLVPYCVGVHGLVTVGVGYGYGVPVLATRSACSAFGYNLCLVSRTYVGQRRGRRV